MASAEQKLLRDMLHAAYLDINPEISDNGANLVRRLAEGLYTRGARISIGVPEPTQSVFIHHSIDPLGNVLWTGRRWNQILGYNSQAPVGKHISTFLEPSSYKMFEELYFPELVRTGKVEGVPVILLSSTNDQIHAVGKSEILRDERGAFLRTFAKLKVALPASLARMAS